MSVAIITGASQGFGRALAHDLAHDGWELVLDAREPGRAGGRGRPRCSARREGRGPRGRRRRRRPSRRAGRGRAELGGLDLLVNNASALGPSPHAHPRRLPARRAGGGVPDQRDRSAGPRAAALPALLAAHGAVVNVTSDAAVEGYEGWGGYGSSKAALEQVSNVLAAEQPALRVYRFDPGDMRTQMHQDAFPGEDISDRPEPESVVPALLRLLRGRSAQRSLPGRCAAGGTTMTAAAPSSGLAAGRTGEAGLRPPAGARSRGAARSAGPDPRRRPHDGRPPRRPATSSTARSRCCRPSSSRATSSSSTRPAPSRPRIDAVAADGTPLVVHLSTQLAADRWVVELRRPAGRSTERWSGPPPPSPLSLGPDAARSRWSALRGPPAACGSPGSACPNATLTWLAGHGRPIRYGYVERPWPLSAYQNVYATEPGSAEMPSAGRPFTTEVITRLVAKGVGFSPLVLHTGVASLEADELPYPEHVHVPVETADRSTPPTPAATASSRSARPSSGRSRARPARTAPSGPSTAGPTS